MLGSNRGRPFHPVIPAPGPKHKPAADRVNGSLLVADDAGDRVWRVSAERSSLA